VATLTVEKLAAKQKAAAIARNPILHFSIFFSFFLVLGFLFFAFLRDKFSPITFHLLSGDKNRLLIFFLGVPFDVPFFRDFKEHPKIPLGFSIYILRYKLSSLR
jgi:hypothetical protein